LSTCRDSARNSGLTEVNTPKRANPANEAIAAGGEHGPYVRGQRGALRSYGAQRLPLPYGLREPQQDGGRPGHQHEVRDERQVQRPVGVLREHAGEQRAAAQSAHVGGRRHERGPGGAAVRRQLHHVRRGGPGEQHS
jgi:hypothetical protein